MPGINVGRVGFTYNPPTIADSRAPSVRCTYHPDTPISDGRDWLVEIHAHDMTVLMVLDNDTHFWEAPQQWRDGVARVRNTYGDLVDVWQVCNEPDAGWFPGTTETIEERAAHHPSSWVMSQDDLSTNLAIARQVLGQNAVIIGPGLSSGHPEWAADVDWSPVDMIACHPYAKDAGSPELMALIAAYSAFGWPVAATEYDATTPGMHRWMAKNMSAAWAFCWSNAMHAGHGLIERPECYAEFKEANQLEEPMPDERVFDVGTGLLEMMAQDSAKPITDSTFLPLGRHPAYVEESMADNGIVYRWSLIQNKGYRYRP